MTKSTQWFVMSALLLLSGCNLAKRLGDVGEPPDLSQIQDPTHMPHYKPITMPMPSPTSQMPNKINNSLWETGSRAFFKDQRANKVGDVITVKVNVENQKATLSATTNTSRLATQETALGNMMGFEHKVEKLFPKKFNPTNALMLPPLLNMQSNPKLKGDAKYDGSDALSFDIAAVVIQLLPNGNLIIQGRREMRVYNEVRELFITGIVRKEDITSGNTITLDKIAEARLSYGGRGDLTDMQSAPWMQQALTKVMPF